MDGQELAKKYYDLILKIEECVKTPHNYLPTKDGIIECDFVPNSSMQFIVRFKFPWRNIEELKLENIEKIFNSNFEELFNYLKFYDVYMELHSLHIKKELMDYFKKLHITKAHEELVGLVEDYRFSDVLDKNIFSKSIIDEHNIYSCFESLFDSLYEYYVTNGEVSKQRDIDLGMEQILYER